MFMEIYRGEEREEGDRRGQEDKGGSQKERDSPASNQFPKCSPQSRTHKEIQSWVEKGRGRKEIEVTWWGKRRVQRGREQ